MDKIQVGTTLGYLSIVMVLINILIFFIMRGPNVDLKLVVKIYSILSILGILFSIATFIMSKKRILFILGLVTNGTVLILVYFLLLAIGISEP
ncbi:hypothetical protein MUN88_08545 [Gracilibacillus caseinilyticus]|uniref:YesK-like protein n=1 Tax=Gracilibacillus caseinilyticus TaxID=2932256 RepID=A0ABY4F0A2_9BACI|nr:hypothetical protein [Gracilibacillus caseinilyticus]UOQ50091.1 hypothetical protein MUN88_08545 [Gracilibacillus caseinilyticus]